MDEETKTIVIGVCSAVGGFISVMAISGIIWHFCCGSLCKEETSSKPRNDTEQNQNVNLKRAQEILEKNRLKKKIAEDMKNRQEIYQYDQ